MSDPDEGDHACPNSDRRHKDEQLLTTLRADGLRGTAFDSFVDLIIKYATDALWTMVLNEKIWAELKKIDRPRTRPDYWGERDKEELINDSVHDGFLDFYQKILVEGGWDPSQKASLNTLFVRYCLSQFADHYEAWERKRPDRLNREAQRDPELRGPQQAPSAERWALAKQEMTKLSIVQFARVVGYSLKEIGQMLGISDRAVEGRLRRHRQKNLENGDGREERRA